MESLTLRTASPKDAPALAELHVASWRETYSALLPSEMLAGLSVQSRMEMWTAILADPLAFGEATIYLAEDQDRMVGFGACGRQRDQTLQTAGFSGEISAIYVLRSHQRANVGRRLMGVMGRTLLNFHIPAATLWVLQDNLVARSFYERLGGTVVGEQIETRPGASIVEVAYGWRDLSVLTH